MLPSRPVAGLRFCLAQCHATICIQSLLAICATTYVFGTLAVFILLRGAFPVDILPYSEKHFKVYTRLEGGARICSPKGVT